MSAGGRAKQAVAARSVLDPPDFFGGWSRDDVEFFNRFMASNLSPCDDAVVDWLGIRTSSEIFPALAGQVKSGVPIPDDGFHAEAIEYFALLSSLEMKRKHQSHFVMVELGAAYAPWAVACGVVGLRMEYEQLALFSVEASESGLPLMHDHAQRNGLLASPQVSFTAVNAVVHVRDEAVWFPKVDVASDNGAQLSLSPTSVDYRHREVTHVAAPARSLKSLLQNFSAVDFLHADLQGAERALLLDPQFLHTLTEKVSCLFLATQSRLIEGYALERLSAQGWNLVRERPTDFSFIERNRNVESWTTRDGGQFWVNPRFAS